MNVRGKSDRPIVPAKPPNKESAQRRDKRPNDAPTAEEAEGRGLAKGNSRQQNMHRTQGRKRVQSALERVRQAAEKDRGMRFTALMHHVYNIDTLREAYFSLKRDAAPGVDEVTWQQYGEELEENLQDLSVRLKRGAYRARPVRRVYILKADGRQRPIGVTTLEDKVAQAAVVMVLSQVYEVDFLGFSYGFIQGLGQHDALDAVVVGLERRKVNWVLDADIRGFFDAISHKWMVEFLQHRIADQRVARLIKKWLNAGVLEDGEWAQSERGTPQGGSVSPMLANIYLHYVLDLWVHRWRQDCRGDVTIVRYADDWVMGFQYRDEAKQFLDALRVRLSKFDLEVHPEKTRLIEFGRYAESRRRERGKGKPETFDFLGFTHQCGKSKRGRFMVRRRTIRKRKRAKLKQIKKELRRRMHDPVPEVGKWLRSVLVGHYWYYGVPYNRRSLSTFRSEVAKLWKWTLSRRSQKGYVTWERMKRLVRQWFPTAGIYHPFPERRLSVRLEAGAQ